jgi:peptidylprolyl isomerase
MEVEIDEMGESMRRTPSACVVETLENRSLLSGVGVTSAIADVAGHRALAVTAKPVVKAATKTTLTIAPSSLGQPVAFTVSIRAAVTAGAPTGTVSIFDHGKLLASLAVSPTTSSDAKFVTSGATYTLTQTIGGSVYFFGKHVFTARFVPSGAFAKSSGAGSLTVIQPTYSVLPDGVKTATVTAGSGAAIASGQTANVFYTGLLARSGKIFDDSIKDGGGTFPFTLGAQQVITGFDEGTLGMQAGETRVIYVPAAEGYGNVRNQMIPPNSNLIFIVTLESIA